MEGHYKCHQEAPNLSKSLPQNNPWCEMDGQGKERRAMGKGKPSPHGGRDQEKKVAMDRSYSKKINCKYLQALSEMEPTR